MTGTDIAVHEPQSGTLALTGDQIEWTPVQQAALAHIGIDEAPPADQQVFMHVAQRTGLDPFARQLYMIPRAEGSGQNRKVKWTIQTGIDGFRLIADRQPTYRGQVGPQWCGPDGQWTDVWLDRQHPPVAARVGVLRSDRDQPMWGTAMFREYAQTKTWDNKTELTKMWREKSAHMIAKCAEALALRRAFPVELGGLHTDDEMGAARHSERVAAAASRPAAPTTAELTGRDTVVDAEPVPAAPAAPHEAAEDSAADRPATSTQNRRMHALFREAEVTDRDERLKLTGLLLNRDLNTSKGITVADASAVIDALVRLQESGHEQGLPGAVNDLLNLAALREAEEQDGQDTTGAEQ